MAGTTETRDEAQMIASIIAGESHLFHELIRPYERKVYAMAQSFCTTRPTPRTPLRKRS